MNKKIAFAGLVGLLSGAPAAFAIPVLALNTTNQLVAFDSATPGTVTVRGVISQPGIVDIDYSPANGMLYGFTAGGTGYFIDPTNGLATLAVTPLTTLTGVTDADFNPVADRVRLFGTVDQNYRLVPNASAQTGPTASGTPGTVIADGTFSNAAFDLVGNAYDNNFDVNSNTTNLYSIDTAANFLVLHSVGPQFNTVTQVGTGLGFAVGSAVGFDIGQNGIAYVSDGNAFYTANLTTGTLTSAGTIGALGGSVTSIAVTAVPEPTMIGIVAVVGVLGLTARRRRQTL